MKRHSLDVFSLVAGLLFASLGVMFTLDKIETINFDVRWIPAIMLLALGAAGILGSAVSQARRSRDEVSS